MPRSGPSGLLRHDARGGADLNGALRSGSIAHVSLAVDVAGRTRGGDRPRQGVPRGSSSRSAGDRWSRRLAHCVWCRTGRSRYGLAPPVSGSPERSGTRPTVRPLAWLCVVVALRRPDVVRTCPAGPHALSPASGGTVRPSRTG